MSVIGTLSLFVIKLFFPYAGPKSTNSVRNCSCWNISFCDSQIKKMAETENVSEIPTTCNSIFSRNQGSILSSRSQSKAFYSKNGLYFKNLRFCFLRQNLDKPVMQQMPLF